MTRIKGYSPGIKRAVTPTSMWCGIAERYCSGEQFIPPPHPLEPTTATNMFDMGTRCSEAICPCRRDGDIGFSPAAPSPASHSLSLSLRLAQGTTR
jgi:hypothetical protein